MKFIRNFLFPLFILFLIISNYLSSAYAIDPTFQIQGNNRTKIKYIQRLLQDCLNEKAKNVLEKINLAELEQCLLNSKLFSKVTITTKGKDHIVKVEERWTLIPIPYAKSQKGTKSFGIFVMESNFLGLGKMLGFGGAISSLGHSFLLMYRDANLFHSEWGLYTNLRYSKEDFWLYEGTSLTDGFNENEKALDLSFGRKFYTHFNSSIQANYTSKRFAALRPYYSSLNEYRFLSMGGTLSYNPTKFKFYFQEGPQVRLSLNKQVYRSTPEQGLSNITLTFDWQKKIVFDHAIQFQIIESKFHGGDLKDAIKIGGKQGVRGIPLQGFLPKNLFISSIDYQIPFSRPSYGTWTLAPFLDYSYLQKKDSSSSKKSFFSYGIGGYLYLTQIAFPGLGIIVGKNAGPYGTFAGLTIGRGL